MGADCARSYQAQKYTKMHCEKQELSTQDHTMYIYCD